MRRNSVQQKTLQVTATQKRGNLKNVVARSRSRSRQPQKRSTSRGQSRSKSRSRSRSRGRNSRGRYTLGHAGVGLRGGGRGRFTRGGFRGRGRGRGIFRGGVRRQLFREEQQIKSLKKEVQGLKTAKTMSGALTIGMINGNTSEIDILQRQFHIPINPLLLKDQGTGQALTPLSDTAKDYAYWKPVKFHIRLMPFVNASNITGGYAIASLDQDGQSIKDLNIDGLMTRPYHETQIGARTEWKIPEKEMEGQREGWWETDTNNLASNTYGPAVDVHLYTTTYDLLSVSTETTRGLTPYGGPLWNVQIVYTFNFANWEPKPALGQLAVEKVPVIDTSVQENSEGELTATIIEGPTARIHKLTSAADYGLVKRRRKRQQSGMYAAGGPELGETIWQVVENVAELAANAIPGPWSWLIKGGLWFGRRLFGGGSENEDEVVFKLYPSIEAAQRDTPIMGSDIETPIDLQTSDVTITQVNNPNLQNPGQLDESVNVNRYPFPNTALMQDPLNKPGGGRYEGVDGRFAWVVGMFGAPVYSNPTGHNREWVQVDTYQIMGTLTDTNTMKTAGGTGNPPGPVVEVIDVCTIKNGVNIGATACLSHFQAGIWPVPNTTHSVLGDGMAILMTLKSKGREVNEWGGFYRIKPEKGIVCWRMTASEEPVKSPHQPEWFPPQSEILKGGVWVAAVATGFPVVPRSLKDQAGNYVDNMGLLVAFTKQMTFGGVGGFCNGNSENGVMSPGRAFWWVYTGNWNTKTRVTFQEPQQHSRGWCYEPQTLSISAGHNFETHETDDEEEDVVDSNVEHLGGLIRQHRADYELCPQCGLEGACNCEVFEDEDDGFENESYEVILDDVRSGRSEALTTEETEHLRKLLSKMKIDR
uniref:Capsid protein n=1 Tax=Zhejiang chinese fire belly newt astrovirus 2 TaxID=2116142 RepID=A0A2P1GNH4_9VIRU|nr:capsid protein [Zhejiang chinese fire belly newt astrovirus 2]